LLSIVIYVTLRVLWKFVTGSKHNDDCNLPYTFFNPFSLV